MFSNWREQEKTAPCVGCLHYVCIHVYSGAGVTDRNEEDPLGIRSKNPLAALCESDTAVVPTAELTGASVHPSLGRESSGTSRFI